MDRKSAAEKGNKYQEGKNCQNPIQTAYLNQSFGLPVFKQWESQQHIRCSHRQDLLPKTISSHETPNLWYLNEDSPEDQIKGVYITT